MGSTRTGFGLAVGLAVGGLALVAVGCQTYDFEPVTPFTVAQTTQTVAVQAKRLKPNLMLLVDKSGSMDKTIDPGCTGSSCATRISELKAAMATFLGSAGTTARMGLAFFPSDSFCGSSTSLAADLPPPTANDDGTDATLTAKAAEVNSKIQAAKPGGGTPTAASLGFVGAVDGLNDQNDYRPDYVLLLTDGLPNCNLSNPKNVCSDQSAAQQGICKCQTSNCLTAGSCALGCLDEDGSVAQAKALYQAGIRTIVVGFGTDTAGGDAYEVLQQMAIAGNFPPRQCPNGTDAECGVGDTCNTTTKTCGNRFYRATDATSLATALASISGRLGSGDPCVYVLDAKPTDERYLTVLWNGKVMASGANSWTYANGVVTFVGQACTDITASTTANPINVEFRIVEQL